MRWNPCAADFLRPFNKFLLPVGVRWFFFRNHQIIFYYLTIKHAQENFRIHQINFQEKTYHKP